MSFKDSFITQIIKHIVVENYSSNRGENVTRMAFCWCCLLTAGILSAFVICLSDFVVLYLVPRQISFWIIHSLLSFWLLPWAYCFQRKLDSLNYGLAWLDCSHCEQLSASVLNSCMLMLGSTFAPRLCLLTFEDD